MGPKVFVSDGESGGAALEYIVVSIFGLVLALAAMTIVGEAAKEKLAAVEQKLGITLNLEELNPFD